MQPNQAKKNFNYIFRTDVLNFVVAKLRNINLMLQILFYFFYKKTIQSE